MNIFYLQVTRDANKYKMSDYLYILMLTLRVRLFYLKNLITFSYKMEDYFNDHCIFVCVL